MAVAASLVSPVAAATFRNTRNTRFSSRCSGPQGAIQIVSSTGQLRAAAQSAAVRAQHNPLALRAAAASVRRMQRYGLVSPKAEVRFPRTIVHTTNNQLILPDLMQAASSRALGEATNTLTFDYVGWSAADQATLAGYLNTALPKAKQIYGPPAFNLTVKIIQDDTLDEIQGGTYDVSTNEIRIPPLSDNFAEDSYVLLMLVLNAFHDDALLYYDAWEQGFIGAAAYVIQTRSGVSPGYDPVDPGPFYCLSVYEPQNQPELGNSTFYPASGAANMLVWRIAMARAAWLKCWIENPAFFSQFNSLYYAGYSSALAGDIPSLKELAAQVVPTVEGTPFVEWYEHQYVLDTSVRTGAKLFTWNIPLTESVALITELYETLSDGDERPFGGTAKTTYWNYAYDTELYAEEGNTISIPSSGTTPGEGFLLPTFYNIGGAQRITVQIDVAGLRGEYLYPYNVRGFEAGENNFYGAIAGANAGTLDAVGGDGLTGATVAQGVWGGRITTNALSPLQTTVTFTDGAGQKVTRLCNIGWDSYCCFLQAGTQATQSHTYAFDLTGLHLMSLPLAPLSTSAAEVLGIPAEQLLLAWWDPRLAGTNKYRIWPSFPFSGPGRGYWLRVLEDTTVTLTGLQADASASYSVPLQADWNLVGSPRLTDVALEDLQVQVGDDAPLSWQDAITNHVIQNSLYGYSQTAGYELKDTLEPWQGYWVRCLSSTGADLVFPAAATTASKSVPARTVSTGEAAARRTGGLAWRLPLVVQAGKLRSAAAYVGAAADASTGLDTHDLAAPPSFGQYVQVRFAHSDWGPNSGQYLSDVQPTGAAIQSWEMTVSCTVPNADVQVSWPDLTQLPRSLRPILTDATTGARVYMRTTTGYGFRTGAGGGSRVLTLTTDATASPLTVTGLASRSARGMAQFTYTLGTDATVTARVLNVAGRHVRTLSTGLVQTAGQKSLLWNARSDTGQQVPSGLYLMEVVACNDLGQRVRAVTSVYLRR